MFIYVQNISCIHIWMCSNVPVLICAGVTWYYIALSGCFHKSASGLLHATFLNQSHCFIWHAFRFFGVDVGSCTDTASDLSRMWWPISSQCSRPLTRSSWFMPAVAVVTYLIIGLDVTPDWRYNITCFTEFTWSARIMTKM